MNDLMNYRKKSMLSRGRVIEQNLNLTSYISLLGKATVLCYFDDVAT